MGPDLILVVFQGVLFHGPVYIAFHCSHLYITNLTSDIDGSNGRLYMQAHVLFLLGWYDLVNSGIIMKSDQGALYLGRVLLF